MFNSNYSSTPVWALVYTVSLLTFTYIHLDTSMPSVRDLLSLATALKFVAPQYNKRRSQQIDCELKEIIYPIHFGLTNNVITPQEVGIQISQTLYDFFQDNPEFISELNDKGNTNRNNPNLFRKLERLKMISKKRSSKKDVTS